MMRTRLAMAVLLAACGSDEPRPPAPQRSAQPTATPAAAPAAAAKAPQLASRAKVEEKYRKELTQSDFVQDLSGDVNRDPFRSYLVTPAPLGGQSVTPAARDECENQTVAPKASWGELKLMAIITRGTRNFAMFKDGQNVGQIVYQGNCLSKDKVRVLEIMPGSVRVEVRAEAPPGAPAPPAREEKVPLHSEDIEIQ